MIVWKGRGGAIALVTFGSLLSTEMATRRIYPEPNYYQNHGWPKLFGFWLAAAIVFTLRFWLGAEREDQIRYQIPGHEIPKPSEASLFFIQAKYWPGLLVCLGLAFYFVRG